MSANTYFGTTYMQQSENFRLDITNFLFSEVLKPQFYNQVTQNRFPLITIPPIKNSSLGEAVINLNIKTNRLWEPVRRYKPNHVANLQPNGFFFCITPSPQPIRQKSKQNHITRLEIFFSII
jgi:hypothetical protein